jgi:hypothetical protein
VGVHLGIKKATVGMRAYGPIQRHMSAPQDFSSALMLRCNVQDSDLGLNHMLLHSDLNGLLDGFYYVSGNSECPTRLLVHYQKRKMFLAYT